MSTDDAQSGGDDATYTGAMSRQSAPEVSLGDERTLGGDSAASLEAVIDDIEVVDLDARYKPEGTLGQGGMGAVLLATDTRLDRKVAIKRISGEAASNRMALQRFLTEAKSLAALNHPNIVQIYDYGQAKDGPFLIMEYVDGGSLLDLCKQGPVPLDKAVDLISQVCSGLGMAHEKGIIHRDIKPANILINKAGLPKLTDFGLAKAQASDHGQTMMGAVIGTPDFMPPEQQRDAAEVDARSDVWSLAATLYQAVTGKSPKVIRFDLLPAGLTAVLSRALEEEKDARYQSANEFRDAIETVQGAAGRDWPTRLPAKDIVIRPTEAGVLDVGAEGLCYSANNNLVFGDGASGAILRAAGPRLRQAAAHIIRHKGPISVGSCAMTDAYDLAQAGCRKIFHLVTLEFDSRQQRYEPRGKDYLSNISRAVASACHSATEACLASLALPQIGTRVSGLSAEQGAAAVVRGLHAFLLNEANIGTTREFHLCAFHSDRALRAFVNQLHLVRCQCGDILDADTEAVVVSANNWLAGGSGTAKAAAARGGDELARAICALQKERCPLDLGTAVELPSGRIHDADRGHRKRLYYAVSLGYHGFDGRRGAGRIPATPESVYQAVWTTLRMASASAVRSITFPLMGARPGYSAVPEQEAPRVMLRAMVNAINELRPELTLERIVILLPPRHMPLAKDIVLHNAEA